MVQLNKIGARFGTLDDIHAMTDVTGFGLLGHLSEMCEASGTQATVYFDQVPLLDNEVIQYYLDLKCVPGGTQRNWASYGHKIGPLSDRQRHLLCDPQTSGGLLVAVDPIHQGAFLQICREEGLSLSPIGLVQEKTGVNGPIIRVQ
jgi:selenide,water dikinase